MTRSNLPCSTIVTVAWSDTPPKTESWYAMPNDDNIITWNVTNWITIILMASIGFGLLAVVQKYVASKKAS